jgi:hypothetical protein
MEGGWKEDEEEGGRREEGGRSTYSVQSVSEVSVLPKFGTWVFSHRKPISAFIPDLLFLYHAINGNSLF